jgi:hypothetical protein
VTELIAIAKPASIGSHPNIPTPIKGTNMPPAIGISLVLYANAQKRFCFIFDTVFLPRSSAVTTSPYIVFYQYNTTSLFGNISFNHLDTNFQSYNSTIQTLQEMNDTF